MTKEEMRIAIAQACGLLNPPVCKPSIEQLEAILENKENLKVSMLPTGEIRAIPNFPEDLNAMAQARKAIPRDLQNRFISHLEFIVDRDGNINTNNWTFATLDATALQQAEAFLRTIGKWQV